MNTKFLILPVIALAACSKSPVATSSATPEPTPAATLDPARAQLLAQIEKLSESECDALVLQFQIIPRKKILNPANQQKDTLKQYIEEAAATEDVATIARVIKEKNRRPMPGQ